MRRNQKKSERTALRTPALRELSTEQLDKVVGGKYIGETEKHLAVPAVS